MKRRTVGRLHVGMLGLSVVAVVAGASCSHLGAIIKKPQISLVKMNVTEVSLDGLAMGFDLEVDNPNPFGISLASLGYALNIEGRQVATGLNKSGLEVPAQGKGIIHLPMAFQFVDVAETIQTFLTKKEAAFGMDAKFGFSTPAGVIEAPVNVNGKVPLPKLPEVTLTRAEVAKVDLRGASLELGLGMKNPNAFQLPLGKLIYRVLVDDTPVAEGNVAAGSLAPGGSSNLTIPVQVSLLGAAPRVLSSIRKGNAQVKLDGSLDLGRGNLPLSLVTGLLK